MKSIAAIHLSQLAHVIVGLHVVGDRFHAEDHLVQEPILEDIDCCVSHYHLLFLVKTLLLIIRAYFWFNL